MPDDWEQVLAEQATSETNDVKNGNDDLQQAQLENLQNEQTEIDGSGNPSTILDIPVSLSVETRRSRISIRNLLQLNQGSVVELDRLTGSEPLGVTISNTLIAHGEVVVIN